MSAIPDHLRRAFREKLRAAQNDRCHWCSRVMHFAIDKRASKLYATFDHVTPRCQGGSNALDNLVLACFKCNHRRGSSGDPNYRPNWTEKDLDEAL